MKEAIFGGGCFWCLEAAFEIVDGVVDVESGYANGHVENPAYKEVCTDTTGHAEVVKITYNESKISYQDLLELFFKIHDATTLNRQGADYGSQYRSTIITIDSEQEKLAKEYIERLQKDYDRKIVTKVEPLKCYYKAEEYHQDYFRKNPNQPYCMAVAQPKVEKSKEWIKTKGE